MLSVGDPYIVDATVVDALVLRVQLCNPGAGC